MWKQLAEEWINLCWDINYTNIFCSISSLTLQIFFVNTGCAIFCVYITTSIERLEKPQFICEIVLFNCSVHDLFGLFVEHIKSVIFIDVCKETALLVTIFSWHFRLYSNDFGKNVRLDLVNGWYTLSFLNKSIKGSQKVSNLEIWVLGGRSMSPFF